MLWIRSMLVVVVVGVCIGGVRPADDVRVIHSAKLIITFHALLPWRN